MRGDARPIWRTGLTLLLLLLAALAFVAIQLDISSRIGRLSSVPNYDDVAYLNSGSEIYFLAKSDGTGAALKHFFTRYLHSPFVIFNALLGFALFGSKVRLIYYMLTVVVFTYLAGIAFLARRLPPWLFAAMLGSALCLPFAALCAIEFRPDLMWAALLGAAGVIFLSAEHPFEGRAKSLLYGAALGGVLLVKPSTFAMSLLVMGGVWFLAAALALIDRRSSWRQVSTGLGLTTLAALVVAGWYVLPHAGDIFSYFYRNSFGDYKDVWSFRNSPWERWTYYVRGSALVSNLGPFFVPMLVVYLGGAMRDVFWGGGLFERLRGGAFLWMLVALLAVNSAFGMKSPFLGGSFYGFLIFGVAWYGCRLLEQGIREGWLASRRRQAFGCLSLLSVATLGGMYPPAARLDPVAKAAQKSINNGILQDMLHRTGESGKTSLMVTQGNPVVWEYLQMEFRRRGKKLEVKDAKFARDMATATALAGQADFVALQDQMIAGSPEDVFPAGQLQPALLEYFSTNPQWSLVASYPDPAGKHAYLYGRVSGAK